MGRLRDADLTLKYGPEEGEERLAATQRRLLGLRLQHAGLLGDGALGPPLAVLFEGWDASGKGGAIKRLVAPLDPRHVHVVEFAAPDAAAKRHHFLWRFWPALPGWGGMAVFDRTWYGRVLVERVDGLATPAEVERAYDEIVQFERLAAAEGMWFVKVFLHISDGEQLHRFQARQRDPFKRWKLTDDDWRNRGHRVDYEAAIEDMLRRTEHEQGRWHVVPAESKRYARVAVVELVNREIEAALRAHGREPERLM
jgi:polyphosphate kinase 2 (PPK2 family)